MGMVSFLQRITARGHQSIDGASLAVLRFGLGLLIVYDALRKGGDFFSRNDGKVFTFPLHGFEWVPSAGEYGVEASWLWAACGAAISIGLFYRAACILAFILAGWGFVQAQEYYLNHYYLLLLVNFLMILVPAHRCWSVDALIGRVRPVRRIHLWLLKGQVEIVLLYAGIVKINHDWLMGEPLRSWLLARRDISVIGPLLDYEAAFYAASYGTILLHILGAPLLFFKRTRLPIFAVYCLFHLSNHHLFDIGIFPWMTIALTTIFFAPDWPRRAMFFFPWAQGKSTVLPPKIGVSYASSGLFAGFVVFWLSVQALFPLRHLAHPGDVSWTYEGHMFSWRMKLVDRESAGLQLINVDSISGRVYLPPLPDLLSLRQERKVFTRPRLVAQLAAQQPSLVSALFGGTVDAVYALMPVSVNGRPYQPLIKPQVNLLSVQANTPARTWLTLNMEHKDPAPKPASEIHHTPPASALQAAGLGQSSACHDAKDGWIICEMARPKFAEY